MYKWFAVDGFRGLRGLRVDHLARVNLIVGQNEAGKSSLLEALMLFGNPFTPALTAGPDTWRGVPPHTVDADNAVTAPWRTLFFWFDVASPVVMRGATEDAEWQFALTNVSPTQDGRLVSINLGPNLKPQAVVAGELQLKYEPQGGEPIITSAVLTGDGAVGSASPNRSPLVSTVLEASYRLNDPALDAARYGRLDRANRHAPILRILRLIEPGLKRLATIARAGMPPILYADIGGSELIPVPLLGTGLRRLASYAIAAGEAAGGLLLIDEIDGGLHTSLQEAFWRAIVALCRDWNLQLIATTHSIECLTAAVKAVPHTMFAAHRLERDGSTGLCKVVSFDAGELDTALSLAFEVR